MDPGVGQGPPAGAGDRLGLGGHGHDVVGQVGDVGVEGGVVVLVADDVVDAVDCGDDGLGLIAVKGDDVDQRCADGVAAVVGVFLGEGPVEQDAECRAKDPLLFCRDPDARSAKRRSGNDHEDFHRHRRWNEHGKGSIPQ